MAKRKLDAEDRAEKKAGKTPSAAEERMEDKTITKGTGQGSNGGQHNIQKIDFKRY